MDIDAIIAEGLTPSAENAQPQADATTQATEETKLPDENAEPDAGKSDDDAPFPKKALNALSRRDKQIGKLRAQHEQAMAELNQLRQSTAPKPTQQATGAPKEADFTNYADYLQAVNNYNIEQKFAEYGEKQTKTQQADAEKAWENQRIPVVDKQVDDFVKDIPDSVQIFNDNADLIKSFPDKLKRVLLAADNSPLAVYNLAKDDKLADLADMSLEDAKVEIRLAQMKPAAKPKTSAPAPLSASRGSVAPSKSLDSMNGDELLKWVNSK